MSQPEFNVEVATLDQHGDPGFVWYRGAFYTPRFAGRFALTQAAALSDTRDVDRVSVVIDSVTEDATRRDVEFIGSPGELAAELTDLPGYKNGVLRTVVPAPHNVTTTVTAALRWCPPLPATDIDAPGVTNVEVYSTRPGPIPNSRTDVGAYADYDARRVAELLVQELGGTIEPMRSGTVLRVTHAADVSDTDRVAADRFTPVNNLRANIAVLDPVADAEHIAALAGDLEELRARSAPALRAESTATVATSATTTPSAEVDRASTRPRGVGHSPAAAHSRCGTGRVPDVHSAGPDAHGGDVAGCRSRTRMSTEHQSPPGSADVTDRPR